MGLVFVGFLVVFSWSRIFVILYRSLALIFLFLFLLGFYYFHQFLLAFLQFPMSSSNFFNLSSLLCFLLIVLVPFLSFVSPTLFLY